MKSPVEEYMRRSTLRLVSFDVWFLAAALVVAAFLFARGSDTYAVAILATAAISGLQKCWSLANRVHARSGSIRRGTRIVHLNRLARIAFKFRGDLYPSYPVRYDVELTDRDGNRLRVTYEDTCDTRIRGFIREGVYASIASGLVIDPRKRYLLISRLNATEERLARAAATAAARVHTP